jgi:hypothetical protein
MAEAGGDPIDHGTALTALKMRQKPLTKLVDEGKIGMEEMQSADEICTAFSAIASRLSIRGGGMDRVDGGGGGDAPWSAGVVKIIQRYQAWANHWSRRAELLCDPMLEVVVAAVIDERPARAIAADVCRRPSTVEQAIGAGLRDYAARAGIVSGTQAQRYIAGAESVFVRANPILAETLRRARIET